MIMSPCDNALCGGGVVAVCSESVFLLRQILQTETQGRGGAGVTYCILSRNRVGSHEVHNVMKWIPHGVYHGHINFPVSLHGINVELF